jgi:hypothetical protein
MRRQPRPPGATNKKKRLYDRGGYDYYKDEWERHRKDPDFGKGYEWLTEPPALLVAGPPFLATLNELGNLTQEPRFHELRHFIMRSDLIDDYGNWATAHYGLNLCNPLVQKVCEDISEAINKRRRSRRVILAEVVAKMQIVANSFEAAHKRLNVLLRAWRHSQWNKQLRSRSPSSNPNL